MADLVEILFTSDNSDAQSTYSVWDHKTGNQLMLYRGGGATNLNGFSLIKYDFIISANSTKPLIHIWPVNSQEQIQNQRFVMPGRVNSLSVSSDGVYCAAGLADLVYIWHIPTGRMVASLGRHFQTVSVIKFTDDNSHFISAGQDGIVLVWSLSDVLSIPDRANIVPKHSFSDHTLPVTGIKVGLGGLRAMLYTISMDRTCRIYDLSQGQQLMNLVFQDGLTSIAVDRLETRIFVGCTTGGILEFQLTPPPRMMEYHLEEKDMQNKFVGHKGNVTCLSLSMDNETMASGGQDQNVIIWHIESKQMLKTIPHKGIVTTVYFTITPPNMFNPQKNLNLITGNFQRVLEGSETFNDVPIRIVVKETGIRSKQQRSSNKMQTTNGSNDSEELQKLRLQVKKLQKTNKELFNQIVKSNLK